MRRLSLNEFDRLFKKEGTYYYSYEDQPDDCPARFIRFQLKFRSMVVAINPNAVMFKSDNGNMMCIDCVKYVEIDDEGLAVGHAVTLFFGTGEELNKAVFLFM